MVKHSMKVTLYLTCNQTVVIDDAVDAGQGSGAWTNVRKGHDVLWQAAAKDTFIPWDSICYAEMEDTVTTVTVTDDTCQP